MEVLKLKQDEYVPNHYTGVIEFYNGNKYWYKEGKLHREDGPAVEYTDGTKKWWIGGVLHRIDGPAVEMLSGSKLWYIDNVYLSYRNLEHWLNTGIFLGKEKGKYGLEWLKFLTETGIEEYPLIPGMNYEFVQRYNLQSFLAMQENVLK